MNTGNTFRKYERLTNRNSIEQLFEKGTSFTCRPVRVIYQISDPSPFTRVKVLITVPRKNVRSAVGRNRIKRLIKEAYRLNKHILSEHLRQSCYLLNLALIYTGDSDSLKLKDIEIPVKKIILKLTDSISV